MNNIPTDDHQYLTRIKSDSINSIAKKCSQQELQEFNQLYQRFIKQKELIDKFQGYIESMKQKLKEQQEEEHRLQLELQKNQQLQQDYQNLLSQQEKLKETICTISKKYEEQINLNEGLQLIIQQKEQHIKQLQDRNSHIDDSYTHLQQIQNMLDPKSVAQKEIDMSGRYKLTPNTDNKPRNMTFCCFKY